MVFAKLITSTDIEKTSEVTMLVWKKNEKFEDGCSAWEAKCVRQYWSVVVVAFGVSSYGKFVNSDTC